MQGYIVCLNYYGFLNLSLYCHYFRIVKCSKPNSPFISPSLHELKSIKTTLKKLIPLRKGKSIFFIHSCLAIMIPQASGAISQQNICSQTQHGKGKVQGEE
ncbi:hypothetical protein NEOLI_005477 [Neolecta irregularis DAH-3]|uniref:Uncharacterized protein n=1 Tax=Neolecta irregularis (strain DAH-3) TaxID=1198029 RepID=A0A1U7LSS8_NEOID|nr:hypothetical protein NEOLI_005477 [Neolecta irregularis DAH-3]|eukprot:OLL25717.1 hypothetical protein NEOLI_005477 [Neolecta irregularis DAH-3]